LERQPIVGVIGGGEREKEAYAVGAQIAKHRAILLTGGEFCTNGLLNDEVKNASMVGFKESSRSTTGLIGILSSEHIEWDLNTRPGALFLRTGLTAYKRDPINGLTPDIVIAFRGGEGTLCELAFAVLQGKPIFLADPQMHHYKKLNQHRNQGTFTTALVEACKAYPFLNGQETSEASLGHLLERFLNPNQNAAPSYSAERLAKALNALPTPLLQTGFPGLPSDMVSSKKRFEEAVFRISKDLSSKTSL